MARQVKRQRDEEVSERRKKDAAERRVQPLTAEQTSRLIAPPTSEDPHIRRMHLMICLLLATHTKEANGITVIELLWKVEVGHVDLSLQRLHVGSRSNARCYQLRGKLFRYLTQYLEEVRPQLMSIYFGKEKSILLFPPLVKQDARQDFWHRLVQYGQISGVPELCAVVFIRTLQKGVTLDWKEGET